MTSPSLGLFLQFYAVCSTELRSSRKSEVNVLDGFQSRWVSVSEQGPFKRQQRLTLTFSLLFFPGQRSPPRTGTTTFTLRTCAPTSAYLRSQATAGRLGVSPSIRSATTSWRRAASEDKSESGTSM